MADSGKGWSRKNNMPLPFPPKTTVKGWYSPLPFRAPFRQALWKRLVQRKNGVELNGCTKINLVHRHRTTANKWGAPRQNQPHTNKDSAPSRIGRTQLNMVRRDRIGRTQTNTVSYSILRCAMTKWSHKSGCQNSRTNASTIRGLGIIASMT